MIDIHSHLLFSVDDGAKSLEESIRILKELEQIGYTDIVLTPHYISESRYNSNKDTNLQKIGILKEEIKKENIHLNLYLGNEIFINDNILNLLKEREITALNDSSYLLIELPISGEYENSEDIFLELINLGYKVILAHPERYFSFQKNFNKVYELEQMGVLFQCNVDSLIGGYGANAKKMVKRLLKEHKVSFLATDIHHSKSNYDNFNKVYKKALKYISNEEYNELTNINPSKIIDNDII
jgi:protein-tyrosine phosphatase